MSRGDNYFIVRVSNVIKDEIILTPVREGANIDQEVIRSKLLTADYQSVGRTRKYNYGS